VQIVRFYPPDNQAEKNEMITNLLDQPAVMRDITSAPAPRAPLADIATRDALGEIVQTLHSVHTLDVGEEAIDGVAKLLGMPWACWSPDTSRPYTCPHSEDYSRSRGWPTELLELWQTRHTALKMPFYIRCRFEHLPFVTALDGRNNQRTSPEYLQVDRLVHGLGITTMLTVPLHLPKGQVAMLNWAGNRKKDVLQTMLHTIEGELLALGHNFMRIYMNQIGLKSGSTEERARLTPREWDCLRSLAQGYREAEVADLLGILKTTVRFHLDNVVTKFGCRNRTQAVALAAQLGLLGPIGQ
jgi:DNA-binding CsgD family transcriptional regulator